MGTVKRSKIIEKLNVKGIKATTKDSTVSLMKKMGRIEVKNPHAMNANKRNKLKRQRRLRR